MSTPRMAGPVPVSLKNLVFGVVSLAIIVGTIAIALSSRQYGLGQRAGSVSVHGGGQVTYPTLQLPAKKSDWPGFLYNSSDWSDNPNEQIISAANANHLQLVGYYGIGQTKRAVDAIVSTIAIVGDMMYFGSWNGTYYAFNTTTHQLVWQKAMGVLTPPLSKGCNPPFAGVTSKATIVDGVLYVGGADGKLYAINARSGQLVWATQVTAPIPPHDGYPGKEAADEFLWSSPSIGNNHVYIDIGSYGDCPLIAGHMMQLDQATGAIQHYHWTDVPEQGGVTIWNRAILDPQDHAVLFATGSLSSGPESDAIVELDWDTLALKSRWQVPVADQGDNDAFGASCTLVPNIAGYRGIVCHSKATRLYGVAIEPDGLHAVWRHELGNTDGQAPEYGQADAGEAAFDGKTLYVGSTRVTDPQGVVHRGAVYAVNPVDGTILWTQYYQDVDGYPATAPAVANGVVAIGMANEDGPGTFLALDAKTGRTLYRYPLSATVYGAPIILNGQIYVPTYDGRIYIFGLTTVPAADVFTHGSLAQQWAWVNEDPKRHRQTAAGLHIDAAGTNAIDAKNMLAESAPTGSFSVTTQLTFAPTSQYEQAGMTVYQDANNYLKFDLINTNVHQLSIELSTVVSGQLQASLTLDPFPATATLTMQLVRFSGQYFAYVSDDGGQNWVLIKNDPIITTVVPQTIGLFATNNSQKGDYQTATFANCVVMPLAGNGS